MPISTNIQFIDVYGSSIVQVEVTNGGPGQLPATIETAVSWTPANRMLLQNVLTPYGGFEAVAGSCTWAAIPIAFGETVVYQLEMCRKQLGLPTVSVRARDIYTGEASPPLSKAVPQWFRICSVSSVGLMRASARGDRSVARKRRSRRKAAARKAQTRTAGAKKRAKRARRRA